MNIINQYSYVIGSLIMLVAGFAVLRRFHVRRLRAGVTLAAIGILLLAGFLVLRPGASDVDDIQAAEALLNNGRPTFLEFFSNYCGGCLTVKPIVDGIVSDIEDDYNILRVDIHTPVGRELRSRLGFSFTPEFVLFDSQGEEIWRDHLPPSDDRLASALGNSD